jgi:hypothetical protein
MTNQVLFIQGGGEGTHDEWDNKIVDSLKRELGPDYAVRYPRMPNEADPKYAAWKADGTATISNSPISARNCLKRPDLPLSRDQGPNRPARARWSLREGPSARRRAPTLWSRPSAQITTCLTLPPISDALELCVVSPERPVPKKLRGSRRHAPTGRSSAVNASMRGKQLELGRTGRGPLTTLHVVTHGSSAERS